MNFKIKNEKGSKIYYDRDKQTKDARKVRSRRQELYLQGKLSDEK